MYLPWRVEFHEHNVLISQVTREVLRVQPIHIVWYAKGKRNFKYSKKDEKR